MPELHCPFSTSNPALLPWSLDEASRPSQRRWRVVRALLTLVLVGIIGGGPAHAKSRDAGERGAACSVPSGEHATLTAAIEDLGCAQISLAGGSYSESVVVTRSVTIDGPAAGGVTIRGRLLAAGESTLVVLRDLELESACASTLEATGGAEIDATSTEVLANVTAGCPTFPSHIFASSFESGALAEWGDVSP